jgi:hypothetical protein
VDIKKVSKLHRKSRFQLKPIRLDFVQKIPQGSDDILLSKSKKLEKGEIHDDR